ncbi:MAG: inverse autotransporter beta domain-containing protein [Planctomycetaceae bacterium]|nr:inverse autotransporter beta domain-containing protein [Planctomycetaceae bacterium]
MNGYRIIVRYVCLLSLLSGAVVAQVLTPPIPDDVDLYALPLEEFAEGPVVAPDPTLRVDRSPNLPPPAEEWPTGPITSEPTSVTADHPDAAATGQFVEVPEDTARQPVQASAVPSPAARQSAPPQLLAAPRFQRFGYSTPVRVQFFGGDSYVEPNSFLSLEMLRPLRSQLYSDGSEQIQYFDGRLGISTDGGGYIGNFGFGQRVYSERTNSIVDLNLWYDFDRTSDRTFHQVTGGGQIQNESLLFRGHYYLPVGTDELVSRFSGLTGNTAFQGNALALERFRLEEQAFKGFDLEFGMILPFDDSTSRWFVGYYNFEAENADPVKGWSSTITVEPVPRLTVGFQVTVDEEADDPGFLFTCSYDFYHGPRDRASTIRHRLGESVRRNHHMVTRGTNIYDPVLAEDAGGNVLNFIHVSSTGGGAGTAESPHALLASAAADAAATPGSVIFAHADSLFDGQAIVLPDNTRFLGEGIDHTITTAATQLGDITLPRITAGTALPIIRNAPGTGPAITLANTTEVNGFRVENAAATGILGTGATTDSRVLNTVIDGAVTGIELTQFAGSYTFDGVSIANTTGVGLLLDRGTPASTVDFAGDLAITTTGSHGIHFRQMQDDSSTTFAQAVRVTDAAGNGIFFDDSGDNTKAAFSGAVTVENAGGSGLVVSNLNTTGANTSPDITFPAGLSVTNPTLDGVQIDSDNSNIELQSLVVTNWGRSGVAIDGSSGSLTVTDPLNLNNANGSLSSSLQIINSSGSFTFGSVAITDTARTAIGAPTVFLSENATGLNDITFSRLDIDATNGIALFAQDLGATVSKLVISDGVISSVNGTAVSLTRLSTDIRLTSVSAANTAVGISLNQIGQVNAFHTQFAITGDGLTAGSGGTISNVQQGVLIDGAEDVSLRLLDIRSSVAGVVSQASGASQPENLMLDRLTLSGGTSANWTGIDVTWGNGAHFSDPNVFSGNTILGAGADQTGFRLVNTQSNPEMLATISGNVINLTGVNSDGILLTARGFGVGQVANFGGIRLSGAANNQVTVLRNPFVAAELDGATIEGSILVNGAAIP